MYTRDWNMTFLTGSRPLVRTECSRTDERIGAPTLPTISAVSRMLSHSTC